MSTSIATYSFRLTLITFCSFAIWIFIRLKVVRFCLYSSVRLSNFMLIGCWEVFFRTQGCLLTNPQKQKQHNSVKKTHQSEHTWIARKKIWITSKIGYSARGTWQCLMQYNCEYLKYSPFNLFITTLLDRGTFFHRVTSQQPIKYRIEGLK